MSVIAQCQLNRGPAKRFKTTLDGRLFSTRQCGLLRRLTRCAPQTTLLHFESHISKDHAGQLRVAVGCGAEHETVVFLVLMMTVIGCIAPDLAI